MSDANVSVLKGKEPSLNRFLAVGASMLCLAVWSSGAQAQSSVTMYGLIDLSVGRTQAPGAVASKGVDSGKMTTSYIGMKGEEDLGNGTKALFALETFMRSDTGQAGRFDADTFWARNALVGMSSANFGTLTFGRVTTSLFVQTLLFNAFGDSFGFSPSIRHVFTSSTVTGDTGWSDSIRYVSPNWGGFSFNLQASPGEGNGGRNYGAAASYGAGGLGLGLAWQQVKKGASVQDTNAWQLAASYDFKVVKAFAQFTRVENETTTREYDIVGLGLSAPIGAGRFLAQWGRISPDTGAKRTTMTLGYDHFLSKRTDAYGVLMNDKISGVGTGNSYSVGVRHRF